MDEFLKITKGQPIYSFSFGLNRYPGRVRGRLKENLDNGSTDGPTREISKTKRDTRRRC